jgi:hypothetical protein
VREYLACHDADTSTDPSSPACDTSLLHPLGAPAEPAGEPTPAAVDCEGSWGQWGDCSAACDGGTQSRSYVVTQGAQNGGTACPADQSQACNTDACESAPVAVDCEGSWGQWGDCSAACDGGTQSQSYVVTQGAQNGGTACPAGQSQACNTGGCDGGLKTTFASSGGQVCVPACHHVLNFFVIPRC